jgi:inosine-uridine nucleoside N-ribohydrolase
MKIILDTDLAGDIDDAFAHALVQASPEAEILGVTLCDGPTDRRARVSCRMLYECGQHHIPVAAGRPTRQGDAHPAQLSWADGFTRVEPVEHPAADFIAQTLREHPGEVTIVSIGPVTNLADVIEQDPEAWRMVKHVYAMFGSFFTGYHPGSDPAAEWNVAADVESARKFLDSGVPITLAGLDVTARTQLCPVRREKLFAHRSPLTKAVRELYSRWAAGSPYPDPTLHDAVAVSMALDCGFVTTRGAFVRIVDDGRTVVEEGRPHNCRIGIRIDRQALLDWVVHRLTRNDLPW